MTKDRYFNAIEIDAVNDKLFITTRTDKLDQEVSENHWAFSITKELADQIEAKDFLSLLSKIKADRQKQLDSSDKSVNLIYYLWHDEQAGQLRLNFINSNHETLPFDCNLEFVETEMEIIDDFLHSEYLEGLPINELELVDDDESKHSLNQPISLKVYRQNLKKKKD